MAEEITIGSIINENFEVLSVLGEGGFGIVYKAKQLSTGQLVAIKVLLSDKIKGKQAEKQIARFEREMHLIAQLKHPNIVRLIDSGNLPGDRLFTVLEYIEGEELAEIVNRDGALDPREASQLMSQVLDALCAAHAQGIVHRDLKPQNIMVTRTGRRRNAMVLDFGISGVLTDSRDEDYRTLTQQGQFFGTPAYMAPEQLNAQPLTPASDIYAWGLVFLETLTGTPSVEADSVIGLMAKQLGPEAVHIPPTVQNHILGPIIAKAVAKPLSERFATSRDVHDALDRLRFTARDETSLASVPSIHKTGNAQLDTAMGGTSVTTSGLDMTMDPSEASGVPPTDVGSLVEPGEAFSAAEPLRDSAESPSGSNKTLVIAIVCLVVVTLVAAVIFLTSLGSDEPTPKETSEDEAKPSTAATTTPPADAVATAGKAQDTSQATASPLTPESVPVPAAACAIGLSKKQMKVLETFSETYSGFDYDIDRGVSIFEAEIWARPALHVMKLEATWKDWAEFASRAPDLEATCSDQPEPGAPDAPATGITAGEAEGFCQGLDMRLPTAREWEAIARGPRGETFGMSGEMTDGQAAHMGAEPRSAVLTWNITEEGVMGLSGGVAEWVRCTPKELAFCSEDGFGVRGGASTSKPLLLWTRAYIQGKIPSKTPLKCHRREDTGFRCVKDQR